ncbi:cytochrome P460 family protein [Neptuniibacter marinus]|uniref:cytochrome P460 family protein n=1 Tax=Neptuniibacter marinus TaxID=1806670 RepID=UPI0008332E31|nr:cytochrome P460 family protein [Neptuniibacter marinus]
MKKVIALTAGIIGSSLCWAGPGDEINFPADYLTNFTPYLSLNRTQNPDQYIRLYINDKGLSGTEENGQLPYGTVIVGEVYKVEKDADGKVINSTLGERVINKLAVLAVMERREGAAAEYPEGMGNDDWDFAAFKPSGERANKDLTQCAACHAPHTGSHHLFSYQHIIAEQNRK